MAQILRRASCMNCRKVAAPSILEKHVLSCGIKPPRKPVKLSKPRKSPVMRITTLDIETFLKSKDAMSAWIAEQGFDATWFYTQHHNINCVKLIFATGKEYQQFMDVFFPA